MKNSGYVPYNEIWIHFGIRMVIKSSIGFVPGEQQGRVCIRFTDFCSNFIRRPSGGQFSVKVVAIKRNANQSLSVTKTKAIYFAFHGGLARQ